MSGRFNLEDFGRTIGLEGAASYLQSRGWKARREEDRGQIWFESPPSGREDSIHLYLPISEEYADYPARLEELVKAVSIFEERPAIEIVTEMAAATGYEKRPHGPGLPATVQELVEDELRRMSGPFPTERATELMQRLPPLVQTIELVMDVSSPHLLNPKAAGQGAALLAASLAKVLPASGECKLFLWRVCARLMRRASLQLRWIPQQLNEFFDLAVSDEASAPDSVLVWLLENAEPDAATASPEECEDATGDPSQRRPD